MGLFDFLKKKKKKEEAVPESETSELMDLGDVDSLEIDPPETRYTQEYKDFLAALEADERGPAVGENEAEAFDAEEEEEEDG